MQSQYPDLLLSFNLQDLYSSSDWTEPVITGMLTYVVLWSDIWNVSYIELRIWNQVSYDHHSYERNFKQLRIKAWKSQDFNGVWTRDLA